MWRCSWIRLCVFFFRKASIATCFIIYRKMNCQIDPLWKYCHVQREVIKIWRKIHQFQGREFMILSQHYGERVLKLEFKYLYIYILDYVNVFLDRQCIVSDKGLQHKILNHSPLSTPHTLISPHPCTLPPLFVLTYK